MRCNALVSTCLAAMLLALGGCQTLGALNQPTDGDKKETLGKRLGDLLDGQCPIPISEHQDAQLHRGLRILRAEWLIAVATRFGAARIPEYSKDPVADAGLLYNQILKSLRLLQEAEKEVLREPSLFELARADLVMAILRTVYYAVEPAIEEAGPRLVSFIARPDAETVLRAARRLFEDRLYADAYRLTCAGHMDHVFARYKAANLASLQGDARREAIEALMKGPRDRVRTHLLDQCARIARLAGVGYTCGVPQAMESQARQPQPESAEVKQDPGRT